MGSNARRSAERNASAIPIRMEYFFRGMAQISSTGHTSAKKCRFAIGTSNTTPTQKERASAHKKAKVHLWFFVFSPSRTQQHAPVPGHRGLNKGFDHARATWPSPNTETNPPSYVQVQGLLRSGEKQAKSRPTRLNDLFIRVRNF